MTYRTIVAVSLAVVLLPAAAQTPAPAPTEQPAKPHPPLKLRLDDAELRSLTPPTTKETEKTQDGGSLPTLGGRPSPALERKASDVVPKDLLTACR